MPTVPVAWPTVMQNSLHSSLAMAVISTHCTHLGGMASWTDLNGW